ncbi:MULTISPECIES: alginate O-acetyltransferase AlgX-related protein [unclassified Marinovum]
MPRHAFRRALPPTLAASLLAATLLAAPVAAETLYGCSGLAGGHYMASVEGRDGVLFRIDPALKNDHPMEPETVEDLAQLTRTLAAKGTALIVVPVPEKSLAMPRFLSQDTVDFGFDYSLATTVFLDKLDRLHTAGVRVVDIRADMVRADKVNPDGPLPYFKTDPRLTAEGARIAATAIAAAIAKVPGIDDLAKSRFESEATGTSVVDSPARLIRQRHCAEALPEAETETYRTTRTYTAEGAQGIIALLGSEYSDTPQANFAGFLAQESGLDVIQYSVPGGGAFAAISTYLTSAEFQSARPSILVWEFPQSEAPGLYDDQPMQELIAAAGGTCSLELEVQRDEDRPDRVSVDLAALDPEADYMLFVDSGGAPAWAARFAYSNDAGEIRHRDIDRHKAQVPTGRFYTPMTGLWPGGAASVEVTLDVPFGDKIEVRACQR